MRVGRYNKHVTLSRSPQTTPDSDGFFEDLSPKDWWCAVEPQQPWEADAERVIAFRVSGRYHRGITIDTRILWGTRELFVKGVQNVDEANREMVLYCEETVP